MLLTLLRAADTNTCCSVTLLCSDVVDYVATWSRQSPANFSPISHQSPANLAPISRQSSAQRTSCCMNHSDAPSAWRISVSRCRKATCAQRGHKGSLGRWRHPRTPPRGGVDRKGQAIARWRRDGRTVVGHTVVGHTVVVGCTVVVGLARSHGRTVTKWSSGGELRGFARSLRDRCEIAGAMKRGHEKESS